MSAPTRRQLLGGLDSAEALKKPVEIASAIVSAWPDHLDGVARAILALGSTEIHARDNRGKLIVVIEGPTAGAVGATVNAIADLDHVLSAVMVFQASDGPPSA
jgi:periplasmic nitrate reductase NapD